MIRLHGSRLWWLCGAIAIVLMIHALLIAQKSYYPSRHISKDVSLCYEDGNITKPIPARRESFFINAEEIDRWSGFHERVDVLQVVATIDNVVWANVDQVRRFSLSSSFVHVIVTPDTHSCFKLRNRFGHVRCFHDDEVFNGTIGVTDIESVLERVGHEARIKGGPWYLQQILKLGAVAAGLGGLGEYVRIMDGEVVQIKAMNWFTESGEEIFETCPSESSNSMGADKEEPYNDYNDIRYGALWNNLTGLPLVHDHSLIAHLMSMRQSKVRALLTKLSPVHETWESRQWVEHSLKHICDAAAILGFSEYWYYASFALLDQTKSEDMPKIQTNSTCARPVRDDSTSSMASTALVAYLTKTFTHKSYVVLENHRSRKQSPKT